MLYAKESFVEKIDRNIDDLTSSQFTLRNAEINYHCIIDIAYDL